MGHKALIRFAITISLALGLLASSALAQNAASGTISGQVTDPQGAAIAGAEIRLIDKSTSTVKTYLSNESGRYDIFNINPGSYDVTVTRQGFSETKLAAQQVSVGQTLSLNVKLQVGAASTIVEVSAGATAELQTSNASVGSTISGLQLDSLPTPGRDANAFILLQPGVMPNGSIAGAVADQNVYPSFRLDHRQHRWYTFRRHADPDRNHRRVQGYDGRPNSRHQWIGRRPSPDGDQARN
jgi:hypothetical protein